VDDTKEFHLRSIYLEEAAYFKTFNRDYFMDHLLPQKKIPYRNKKDESVKGKHLKELMEKLLSEIYDGKTEFTDFNIIKKGDFNFKTSAGYLILKFKKYPFVLKLSIENPESFVKPTSKGWKQAIFYIMGGANGHCCSATRVGNLDKIRTKIKADDYWSTIVDTPRKWFWLPENPRWLAVKSNNIGRLSKQTIELPSAYGVLSDAIESERTLSLLSPEDRKFALKLTKFVGNNIDAHIDNFMLEKNTGLLVIVDTEDFRHKIGLKRPLTFDSYQSWYMQLTLEATQCMFCRSKGYRRRLQTEPPSFVID
jgi:hypothetical protein